MSYSEIAIFWIYHKKNCPERVPMSCPDPHKECNSATEERSYQEERVAWFLPQFYFWQGTTGIFVQVYSAIINSCNIYIFC